MPLSSLRTPLNPSAASAAFPTAKLSAFAASSVFLDVPATLSIAAFTGLSTSSLRASIPYSSHLAKNASLDIEGLPDRAAVAAFVNAEVITSAVLSSIPVFSDKNLDIVSDTPLYLPIIPASCVEETSPPVSSAVIDAVILSLIPS